MGFDTWLIHTCTIERDQTDSDDDLNRDVPDYAAIATGVRCRMVADTVRNPLPDLGEGAVMKIHQLYLPAGQDVIENDHVTNVLDEDGDAIGDGWKVEQVLKRRGRAVRHITLYLEKIA